MPRAKLKKDLSDYLKVHQPRNLTLYYDGDCPICNNYKDYINLRKQYNIILANAREHIPVISELALKGFDINHGMILLLDNKIFQGSDVLQILSGLTKQSGFRDKQIARFLKITWLVSCIYPLIKGVRWIILKIIRVKRIQIPPQ